MNFSCKTLSNILLTEIVSLGFAREKAVLQERKLQSK